MSNLDHIDLKLGFVFSKSSILILFFILQGIIMSLIIESVLAADVQSRVVTKKNYNPFASLLEIESFPKEPLQHFNSKEPQQSGKVNPELTSKPSASEFFIKLLDILQTSSGTFALVRVKDQNSGYSRENGLGTLKCLRLRKTNWYSNKQPWTQETLKRE